MSEPTADQLTRAISDALKARDLDAVPALIKLLAVRDPERAQGVLDTIELGLAVRSHDQ